MRKNCSTESDIAWLFKVILHLTMWRRWTYRRRSTMWKQCCVTCCFSTRRHRERTACSYKWWTICTTSRSCWSTSSIRTVVTFSGASWPSSAGRVTSNPKTGSSLNWQGLIQVYFIEEFVKGAQRNKVWNLHFGKRFNLSNTPDISIYRK